MSQSPSTSLVSEKLLTILLINVTTNTVRTIILFQFEVMLLLNLTKIFTIAASWANTGFCEGSLKI